MHAPAEATGQDRKRRPGAGLGLSIASGIVAAHGGRIELDRDAPGTCFCICLPVEKPSGPAQTAGAGLVAR
jgi:signal transduction histidine kinase